MNLFEILRTFENINSLEGILEIDNKKFKLINPDNLINKFKELRQRFMTAEISQTEFLDGMFTYRSKKLTCFYFKSVGFNGQCNALSYGQIIIDDSGWFKIKNLETNRVNSPRGIFLILEELDS